MRTSFFCVDVVDAPVVCIVDVVVATLVVIISSYAIALALAATVVQILTHVWLLMT